MRKSLVAALAVTMLLVGTTGAYAADTVTGEIVEKACFVDRGAHGEDHVACAKRCFTGDDNFDGIVDTSQVMVWCEWPAGSAEEQAGAPLEDAKGCLSWIIAPCGGTVVRGPDPDTELPVRCAANEVATIPDSTDPTRVEAPVGQVSARNQKGRRWQTVVGRYVLPFQMFVSRASSTPPPSPAVT